MAKEDAKMTDADAAPDGKAGDDLQQAKQTKLKGKEKAEDKEAELSEEDQELKANLELMVERSRDADPGIAANALEARTSRLLWHPRPLPVLRHARCYMCAHPQCCRFWQTNAGSLHRRGSPGFTIATHLSQSGASYVAPGSKAAMQLACCFSVTMLCSYTGSAANGCFSSPS